MFAAVRPSSALSHSHPDVIRADQHCAQTPECRTCPTLLADFHLQHYFTLSLIRFSVGEGLGTLFTALVLIKNMVLTPLLILDSFNRGKCVFIPLKYFFLII